MSLIDRLNKDKPNAAQTGAVKPPVSQKENPDKENLGNVERPQEGADPKGGGETVSDTRHVSGPGADLPADEPTNPQKLPQNATNREVKPPQPEKPEISATEYDDVKAGTAFIYALKGIDNFSMWLAGKEVKSNRGVFKVNAKQNDELVDLMRSGRPDITTVLVPLDIEAAEKIARKHIAEQKAVAAQGPTGSNIGPGRLPLPVQKVIEQDVMHADDNKLDPEGRNADNIPR